MKKQQSGFTLIELIAVIVILGILAATAVPKFVSLQDSANAAAIEGVASAIGGGSNLNFASKLVADAGIAGPTPVDTTAGCLAATGNALMQDSVSNLVDSDSAGTGGEFVISGGSTFTSGTVTCTLTLDLTSTTATFTLHEAP